MLFMTKWIPAFSHLVNSMHSVHTFYLQPPGSPVLPDNIHKVNVALFSEVLCPQLDQSGVFHPRSRCPPAARHAQTGAGACARARLLLFLLEHVAQGALAGSHRVLRRRRTQETVGCSGALTWGELDQEERGRKRGKERDKISDKCLK